MPGSRRIERWLLAFVAVVCAAGADAERARAQTVGVRAYLTPATTVGVGRPFTLNVEITGAQSLTEDPRLPDLSAFAQYLGSGTQSSVQMVNGRTSVSLTVQYRYQALREGTYDIPAFDVPAGGSTHRTEALRLTVSASPPPAGQGEREANGGVAEDELFVTAEATKTRVREGEPFVVEYRIWTLVDISSFNFTRVPEPEGFWVENVTPEGQPQIERITRNGRTYSTAVIRRVALIPSGTGTRTLEPVGLEVEVRVRRSDPFGDFFGGGLFGSVVPTSVLSNPLRIVVQPLPAGRPEPFSGVVGRLELEASVDRDSVAANEAVTLTVRASGEGNLRAVPIPELGLASDFEIFPPEISESVQPFGPGLTGEKTFEFVLIPRAPGTREIPSVRMGYFDERAGAYRTASTDPLPLTVSGVAAEGAGARGGVALLREDVRFIRLGSDGFERRDRSLFGPAFWIVTLLPLVGVAGSLALRRHRDLLEGDVAYARGRRASRLARKRLAEAPRLAGGSDARAFYAEVARALRGLVADRLNLSEAGLQSSELVERLGARAVPEATLAEVRACLEECDRQRFAPQAADQQEKSRFLERVGSLMTSLDKAVR
ncbi:MAG: BatD family protein [Gemmatimonadales bacterium]